MGMDEGYVAFDADDDGKVGVTGWCMTHSKHLWPCS